VPRKIEISDLDNLLHRYLAGESENKLAREAGINRWTFRRRLLACGIIPRNQSDAELMKWANMSEEQRCAQVMAAHEATRGIPVKPESLLLRAKTLETAWHNVAHVERVIAQTMTEHGFPLVQQKAIGKYNVDLTYETGAVTIEVFGGNWHSSGRHRARFHQRIHYLLNAGWHVVILWIDGRNYPFGGNCPDELIRTFQFARENPTAPRQYRVMRGDGQCAPATKSYLNTPSDIIACGCSLNATGHHDFITR